MSIVVIQKIETVWTKRSRGGENAVRRNAVPEIAKIPLHRIVERYNSLLQVSLDYRESNLFTEPSEKIVLDSNLQPIACGCIIVDFNDREVFMEFRHNLGCGAPERGWMQKKLVLPLNEWGQIVYNGRFNDWDDGTTHYKKTVVNAGRFERVTPGIFTQIEPAKRFSAMAELF